MTTPAQPESDHWRQAKAPPFAIPGDRVAWERRRGEIRATLWSLFGDVPPLPPVPVARILSSERKADHLHERFEIDNGAGARITGHLLVPLRSGRAVGRAPAVIYHHYHGGHYHLGKDEIFQTRAQFEAYSPSADGPGLDLVRRGYVVMATDAYAFGERAGRGPTPSERDHHGEQSTYKAMAWLGRCMWGMMVRDDLISLAWLAARPEVDPARIGATGFSMGSTRSWWLAAFDDRVRSMVGVCCLTRYEELIAAGGIREHGIYYFVPGMLAHFDTEAVVSLIAPRRCLMINGDADGGSPVAGIRHLDGIVSAAWRLYGAPDAYRSEIIPGMGHAYTPQMWARTLAWLDGSLAGIAPS